MPTTRGKTDERCVGAVFILVIFFLPQSAAMTFAESFQGRLGRKGMLTWVTDGEGEGECSSQPALNSRCCQRTRTIPGWISFLPPSFLLPRGKVWPLFPSGAETDLFHERAEQMWQSEMKQSLCHRIYTPVLISSHHSDVRHPFQMGNGGKTRVFVELDRGERDHKPSDGCDAGCILRGIALSQG